MLVEICNLRIQFPTTTGLSDAVRNVSLTLGQEKLGIVGESGSGKSLTARSILRLLPSNAMCCTLTRKCSAVSAVPAQGSFCRTPNSRSIP